MYPIASEILNIGFSHYYNDNDNEIISSGKQIGLEEKTVFYLTAIWLFDKLYKNYAARNAIAVINIGHYTNVRIASICKQYLFPERPKIEKLIASYTQQQYRKRDYAKDSKIRKITRPAHRRGGNKSASKSNSRSRSRSRSGSRSHSKSHSRSVRSHSSHATSGAHSVTKSNETDRNEIEINDENECNQYDSGHASDSEDIYRDNSSMTSMASQFGQYTTQRATLAHLGLFIYCILYIYEYD